MMSRIILLDRVATMLLPESECKGKAKFETCKLFAEKKHIFFQKKFAHPSFYIQFTNILFIFIK